MMQSRKQKETAQSTFVQSVSWLANMLAVIITFLLTPKAYEWTVDWVVHFTAQSYGYGLEDIISVVWGLCLAVTIFCFSRATVSTSLVMGGLALASRMF